MNFSSTDLGCKVSCDKPSKDGCDIINLISGRGNGFAYEGFVLPPVKIRLDFDIPVDISSIVLQSQILEKKTFSLSVYSSVKSSDSECDSSYPQTSKNLSGSKQREKQNVKGVGQFSEYCLGQWYSVSGVVVLKNYYYKHRIKVPLPNTDQFKVDLKGSLRNPNKLAMNNVSYLILKIFNVYPSGSPVFQSVQVWGQPSLSCSITAAQKKITLWKDVCKFRLTERCTITENSVAEVSQNDDHNQEKTVSSDAVVPDEFLDPITCEIMTLPILLPSGNSVDSYTLDRFIGEESRWGRPPCDPFTGVIFKDGYKPEPNVLLKARIDRFLLTEKRLPPSTLENRGHVLSTHLCSVKQGTSEENIQSVATVDKSTEIASKLTRFRDSVYYRDHQVDSPHNDQPLSSGCCKTPWKYTASASGNHNGGGPILPPPPVCFDPTNRYGLVHAIGNAISLASKDRADIQMTKKRRLSTDNYGHTSFKQRSLEKVQVLPQRLTDECESFSLASLACKRMECVCCQNGREPFYSLKCRSHNICKECVKRQVDRATNQPASVLCTVCDIMTVVHDLMRTHPKSAFSQ